MRAVFMGSPEFALPALKKLAEKHEIISVITQPDRKAGRGMKLKSTPVAETAQDMGLQVFKPASPGCDEGRKILEYLKRQSPDFFVVAAYAHFLPLSWRKSAPMGCLNIHPSLLPRWRGAAPVQWALLAGDRETGVSIIRLVRKMDAGPVLAQKKTIIREDEDGGSLLNRLAVEGAGLLIEYLDAPHKFRAIHQNHEQATHARALNRDDSIIRWEKGAVSVLNQVRALKPWPGTFFCHDNQRIKVHAVERLAPGHLQDIMDVRLNRSPAEPGVVLHAGRGTGLVVSCGEDAVKITKLQAPGRRAVDGESFLRGYPIDTGSNLTSARSDSSERTAKQT